jgi:hypothetical protein
MSENKDKPTVKLLPCGGHAIFAVDPKTKQSTQIGYIGKNLPLDGYMPAGTTVQK